MILIKFEIIVLLNNVIFSIIFDKSKIKLNKVVKLKIIIKVILIYECCIIVFYIYFILDSYYIGL